MLLIFISIVISYLLGSISSGILIAKYFKLGNLREKGSGNIGGTNVARIGGKALGALTILLDTLKGVLPVVIFRYFIGDMILETIVGTAAVFGHMYPIWHHFKGGKGVATTFGFLLAIEPLIGTIFALSWISIFFLRKISSLASLGAILVSFFAVLILTTYKVTSIYLILAICIYYKHKENIVRLFSGEETKIKF